MQFIRKNLAVLSAAAIVAGGMLVIVIAFISTSEDSSLVVVDNTTQTDDATVVDNQITEDEGLADVKKPQNEDPTDINDDGSVTPQITSATPAGNDLTVRGFIPETLEEGGECTFYLMDEDSSVIDSVQTTGFINVSSTTCPPAVFNIGSLLAGNYLLQLGYESDEFSGDSVEFEYVIN